MATIASDSQTTSTNQIREATALLLRAIPHGDSESEANTPSRVARAWIEMTEGYSQDPAKILAKDFSANCDDFVLIKGIEYSSICAHHLLPFTGSVSIAYIPANGRVVGLSKLPRLVHCFAKRLQLQEMMTQQIADSIVEHLAPQAVGVIATGTHLCMKLRGVKSNGQMITSAMRGDFLENQALRNEFLSLLRLSD